MSDQKNPPPQPQKNPVPDHFRLDYRQTFVFYASVLGKAQSQSPEELRLMKRRLGSTDLFFLLGFILSPGQRMFHPWLMERCREVQRDPDGYLDLWAREHFKSTIITFGLTIFDIINDPEVTIGIFSHTKAIARDFLSQIKTEMEMNENLWQIWPEIFYDEPAKQSPRWSRDGGIIVRRTGNPKEATVEAHGLVDGMPTGRHFDKMVLDDVVTMESVSTPEQIAKTTLARQMADNLGKEGGKKRYIGTRYHLFDDYSVMLDDGVAIPRIHPATDDGTETGNPVLVSREYLRQKRISQGPYVFNSQQLLNPIADTAMGFRQEWLRFTTIDYAAALRSLWRFIIVDPAGSKKRKNNDYTTFWVIGFGSDGVYRVLDIVRDRLNLTERWNTLYRLHVKWKPSLVAYEEYGMQADREHFEYCMKEKLYEFPITVVGGNMPKPIRILRIVAHFENGWQKSDTHGRSRIVLPLSCNYIDHQGRNLDLVKVFIEEEYTAFPVLKHDDMLDGLARIVDLEEQNLIQMPSIVPAQGTGTGLSSGLKNLGNTNRKSWMTA